jgi:hypothetical protein
MTHQLCCGEEDGGIVDFGCLLVIDAEHTLCKFSFTLVGIERLFLTAYTLSFMLLTFRWHFERNDCLYLKPR